MKRTEDTGRSRWPQRLSAALIVLGWAAAAASYVPVGLTKISSEFAGVFLPGALLTFGQFALATGLALHMSLRFAHGFSALDRFFDAILQRTLQPAAPANDARPVEVRRPSLFSRGFIGERPYALYSDGSVEVETLLGPRRFDSLEAAHSFVGTSETRRADKGEPRPAASAQKPLNRPQGSNTAAAEGAAAGRVRQVGQS